MLIAADRGAERGREADEQGGPRPGEVGGGEDRREGRDRPVDQPDQAGLNDLEQPLPVVRAAPRPQDRFHDWNL
jgi:hypothetical protein